MDDRKLRLGLSERPILPLTLALQDDIEWAAHADEQDAEGCPPPGEIVHPGLLEEDMVDDDIQPGRRSSRYSCVHARDKSVAKRRRLDRERAV